MILFYTVIGAIIMGGYGALMGNVIYEAFCQHGPKIPDHRPLAIGSGIKKDPLDLSRLNIYLREWDDR